MKKKSIRIKKTSEDIFVDAVVYTTLTLLTIITIIPFMQVVTISVSPADVVNKYGLHIIPFKFDFEGYRKVFSYGLIWQGYLNTIKRVVLGLFISMPLMVLGAYPLSKKYLPHRNLWTGLIIFTMYFSGGLIPFYLLMRGIGLYDTMWALVLPGAINTFSMIIIRNFFMSLPEDLEESARIDGANDIYILVKIIIPISKPILATVALWTMVYHWNDWFNCMLYMKDTKGYVLQLVLRRILLDGQEPSTFETGATYVNSDTMKMATLVVSILPIMCTYPFLQKYFVKGVMVGSLKG